MSVEGRARGRTVAVVALYYYLQVARAMYINPAREQRPIALSRSLKIAIVICITFIVGMGAFPNPFVEATSEVAGARPSRTPHPE